jgi:hypothetical protein
VKRDPSSWLGSFQRALLEGPLINFCLYKIACPWPSGGQDAFIWIHWYPKWIWESGSKECLP